ncbi:hypothetical protein GCM10007416_00170 [Kroppenstedtia guangzhouensis]|uniref:DUF1294 domain-containing protein n=2 Tax=Kroppenstedtia guangzhouensis TaxID=1274356 RepID=A0ABQ1FW56_9BACL|nr:hypothetical protein GCM10007416_00170 [Kroppenstedtia guangzhouensis]
MEIFQWIVYPVFMMWILVYLLLINGVTFVLMGSDKARARKGRWRIPERHLFLSGFLGGGPGLWLGMKYFRHKTMHPSFRYGAPLITLWNVSSFVAFTYFYG